MTELSRSFWTNYFGGSVLRVTSVVSGIVLPFDFLLQVDGFLKYLRPLELVSVFAWAWLFYTLLGLVVGIGFSFLALLAAKLFRKDPALWISSVTSWLTYSIVALALIKGGKLWAEVSGLGGLAWWLSKYQLPVVAFVLIACAFAVRNRQVEPPGYPKAASLAIACGLTITLAAPITAFFPPSGRTASPAPTDTSGAATKHPDILLISIDTLAANHTSFDGYLRPTTPNLDKLGSGAHVFTRFYANSNFTTPTVNSFINGVRPWTHRANQAFSRVPVGLSDGGLIARLKNTGYQTYGIWTNPIASPFHNRNEGHMDKIVHGSVHAGLVGIYKFLYPEFPDFLPVTSLGIFATSSKIIDRVAVLLGVWESAGHFDPTDSLSRARDLINTRDPSRPLFLWIHLLQPHDPYATVAPHVGRFDPNTEFRTRFDSSPVYQFMAAQDKRMPLSHYVGRYDEAIASVDSHVGDFLEWLKAHRLYKDTLIVISADHGESFSNDYGGHGGPMLYEDVIRIPLIIKEPGQTQGTRLETLSEQIDLMPTIMDLAGKPIAGLVEGRSLKPSMRGQKMDGQVFSMNFEQNSRFKELTTGSVAMIEGRWKYVHHRGPIRYPLMPKLVDSLYDLQTDSGETTNLIAKQPAIATRMQAAIMEQLRIHGQQLPP